MALYEFFTSRNNSANAASFVGQAGRLFYDGSNGVIKLSDGATPGGTFIPYNIATTVTIGGIKAGPGANVSTDGTLTIDTTGLPLGIGNISIVDTTISTVNANADLILASNGTGNVELLGNIHFHTTDSGGVGTPFFNAGSDGQITILVPAADPAAGAVKIVGSQTGRVTAPNNTGVMLQLTGNNNDPSRLYNDAIGNFAAFVGRRINGNVLVPTAIQAGEEIIRISATGYDGNTVPGSGSARILFQSKENYTTGARGTNLSIWTTAIGSTALTKTATFDRETGLTVAGNISTLNNVITSNIVSAQGSAGNVVVDCTLLPFDANCKIGSPDRPWESAWFGPQSVTLLDSTGNVNLNVTIKNLTGNITMATAGFEVQTLGTNSSIFRIEALTGQIFSNAKTIISNTTDSANISSGSLQTQGGLAVAKNVYIGGNLNVTGSIIGNATNTVANVGTLNVSGNATVTGRVSATTFSGKYLRNVRDAGLIADGGTLTVNFATDALIVCSWGNGLNIAYSNFTPGSVVKVMATKISGSGVDTLNLDGVTAAQTSSGSTTLNGTQDTTTFLEITCAGTSIGNVFVKT